MVSRRGQPVNGIDGGFLLRDEDPPSVWRAVSQARSAGELTTRLGEERSHVAAWHTGCSFMTHRPTESRGDRGSRGGAGACGGAGTGLGRGRRVASDRSPVPHEPKGLGTRAAGDRSESGERRTRVVPPSPRDRTPERPSSPGTLVSGGERPSRVGGRCVGAPATRRRQAHSRRSGSRASRRRADERGPIGRCNGSAEAATARGGRLSGRLRDGPRSRDRGLSAGGRAAAPRTRIALRGRPCCGKMRDGSAPVPAGSARRTDVRGPRTSPPVSIPFPSLSTEAP